MSRQGLPPVRAVIYLRVSHDPTGSRAAVRRQLDACRKLCHDRGWRVIRILEDNDTSAGGKVVRKQYAQMIEMIRAGKVDVIVSWHVDRLTRSVVEVEQLIALSETHGTKIVTINGDLDLSNDSGRLVGRILASVARGELERKSARQRDANQQYANEGRFPSGPAPFGWRKDATHEPAEARQLRQAYAAVLAGATLKGIASDWNKRGVGSGRWTHSSLRKRLLDPRNAGLRAINGQIVGEGDWRPIVDEDTWRAVHTTLTDTSRRTYVGPYARKYLLSGLARCGRCGSVVITGRASRGHRTYVCKLRHLSRKADDIDDLVQQLVIRRLSRSDAAELLRRDPTPDLDVLAERATVLKARLDDLSTLLSEGALTLDGVRRESARLRGELADLEAQLHEPNRAAVLQDLVEADAAEAVWHRLDPDRRRAVVDTLMTVILLPVARGARTFNPDTVDVKWRT